MTKIEKQIIGYIVVVLILLSVSMTFIVKSFKPVQEQIKQGGLKSVVNELWNGKGK